MPSHHHTDTVDSSSPFLEEYDKEKLEVEGRHSRSRSASPNPAARGRPSMLYIPPPRRRWLFVTCAFLSVASLTALVLLTAYSSSGRSSRTLAPQQSPSTPQETPLADHEVVAEPQEPQPLPFWHPKNYVLGPPTRRFRDNLRNETGYITSWISSGWTNDVMTIVNLIYLGIQSSRIPILPPFTPSHIGGDAGAIPVGEIFNLTWMSELIGLPVLEWHDVKRVKDNEKFGWDVDVLSPEGGVEFESIGCWNVWEATQYTEHKARYSFNPYLLGLDISYTTLPQAVKLIPNYEHDKHTTFSALLPYAFPRGRSQAMAHNEAERESLVHASERFGVKLDPDEQVVCYDYLYYLCDREPFEMEFDYSPAWRHAGTYMHWTDRMESIAADYLRTAFALPEGAEIPPYIAIHARHGDFGVYCPSAYVDNTYTAPNASDPSCFAPLPVLLARIRQIQATLLTTKGIRVADNHVIMTSDERDPTWWQSVSDIGWAWIDHGKEGTAAKYGRWYPVLVDAVIQSGGVGFVGTARSTMSLMARRRVEDWRGGVTVYAEWGRLDADNH